MQNLLSVPEVARILGVSVHTVYSWAAEGRMPLVKLGKRTLFDQGEIQRWIGKQSLPERNRARPTEVDSLTDNNTTGSRQAKSRRTWRRMREVHE